jgi:hypothetical protein
VVVKGSDCMVLIRLILQVQSGDIVCQLKSLVKYPCWRLVVLCREFSPITESTSIFAQTYNVSKNKETHNIAFRNYCIPSIGAVACFVSLHVLYNVLMM